MKEFIGEKECLLITSPSTIRYFTSLNVEDATLIITNEEKCLFIDARYYYALVKKVKTKDVIARLYTSFESVTDYLKERKINSLKMDFDALTVTDYNRYKENGFTVLDCSKELRNLKRIKSEREIKLIKRACEITERAFYDTLPYIREGVTEKYIKKTIENFMEEYGAEKPSFETIVAFGKNSAIPHHKTGDQKLTKNSVVLIDVGCIYKGYCSDLTRSIFFGQPTKEFERVYNAVLTANLKAIGEIEVGFTGKDADAVSREYLEKEGYGKEFSHSLGHGVGVEIHEYPRLSPKSEEVLQEGEVFTIEPGIYLNGKFGVRIEDTVTIKKGKIERLFTDGKELLVINMKDKS